MGSMTSAFVFDWAAGRVVPALRWLTPDETLEHALWLDELEDSGRGRIGPTWLPPGERPAGDRSDEPTAE